MSKTLICKGPPEHEWQHGGGRGRPPKFCPDHHPAKKADVAVEENAQPAVNPFIQKHKQQIGARLQKGREEKRVKTLAEQEREQREALLTEYKAIDDKVKATEFAYQAARKAFQRASTTKEIAMTGNAVERQQNALMHLYNRQRILNEMFDSGKKSEQEVAAA